jgi:hypothetical protein
MSVMVRVMTVGVLVKVYDGVVLAADSATSIELSGGGHQVYNNANKIFHLHRHMPLAAMTWGLGNIGSASIATLAKDLRRRFMGRDLAHKDWKLTQKQTVNEVADRLVELIHPLYAAEFAGHPAPPFLGMLVVGYSGGEGASEAWGIAFADPNTPPTPLLNAGPSESGWGAYAQPEAVNRLFHGYGDQLPDLLQAALPAAEWEKVKTLVQPSGPLERSPTHPAMPLADAIALAKFMAEVTAGYSHFLLGPDTVGGTVEVASISRHEGFRWVSRKHYYTAELNPEESTHAY